MTKKHENINDETVAKFDQEIEMLISERRKANKYKDLFYQDEIFNEKSRDILYKYVDHIGDKKTFCQALVIWINMMKESREVENYIIAGMCGVLSSLIMDIATDK